MDISHIPDKWMIFYSALYNIRRITIDQKQTPCTNTTEEIEDATNENKGSAVEDEGHSYDDDNRQQ